MAKKPTQQELYTAIRLKCLDCSGGSRKEVHNCKIKECPLWPYRRNEPKENTDRIAGQISITDFEGQERM